MANISKFTVAETRKAMVLAWRIREKASEKWRCNKMEIHFGACLKLAYDVIKGNKTMDFADWYEIYKQETEKSHNIFNSILRKYSALAINGKSSIDKNGKPLQEYEMEITTSTFKPYFSSDELEDIEQEAIVRIMEKFSKENNSIAYKNRYGIWCNAVYNSAKSYIRQKRKFRLIPKAEEIGSIQDLSIKSNDYNYLLIDMTLKEELDYADYTICKMREYKFKKQEIAEKLGISRQAIHKREKQLPKKVAGII